jgi:hypothetical protein
MTGKAFFDTQYKFVEGWSGVTEDDVVGGGGQDAVPFDPAVWFEFYSDHSELWDPLAEKLVEQYKLHQERTKAIQGN